MRTLGLILAAVVGLSSLHSPARAAQASKELWLYYPSNLLVNENVDRLEQIWTRAAKAGYTHALLGDSKFSRLHEMPQRYFDNIDRVKKIAAGLKLKVVPAVYPVGYSNDLLSRDPNLAEGLPAVDTPFVVKGGEARVDAAREPVAFVKTGFVDPTVSIEGGVATVRAHEESARFTYPLKVRPFRCYHVSVWIKTQDYTGNPEIKALSADVEGRSLQWKNLGVKSTQDWTQHHVVFNSLDSQNVNVYFGVWGGAKGTLQWKDWAIEEVGLLNVLRRPGAPLVVRGEDGKTYAEGTDFEPIADPRMGNQPYSGEFEVWHEPPAIKVKNIPDGTKLRVSWHHPAIIYDGQVSGCLADPKHDQVLADQAAGMKKAWGTAAGGWMMNYDEIRVLGWDPSCRKHNATPGKLLANSVRENVRHLLPAPTYTWSDMFDPHHNAVKGPYYLVKGEWIGSWEGLPKETTIMNWNHGQAEQSLQFFADRGHRQILAGYYDNPDFEPMRQWLAKAEQVKGVVGSMYTTWTNNYDHIEAFARLCREER